jgi:hypothetical protein
MLMLTINRQKRESSIQYKGIIVSHVITYAKEHHVERVNAGCIRSKLTGSGRMLMITAA